MEEFYNKSHYTEEDVNNLITGKIEENWYLEFKRAEALGSTDLIKKEITKDVSSFANTIGGIIIYGIKEENHVATALSFINGNEFTKERLEQIINGNIQRRISGLEIHPIRFDGEITKTVYIVKIPESNDAPHMAKDNRFYKRFNFESKEMEENEVRAIYNRTTKTNIELLEPEFILNSITGNNDRFSEIDFPLNIYFQNIGNNIEDKIRIQLSIPKNVILQENIFFNYKQNLLKLENGFNIFTFDFNKVLFQSETNKIGNIAIKFKRQTFTLFRDNNILVKLYYTGGVKEKKYNLISYLKLNDKLITIDNFV